MNSEPCVKNKSWQINVPWNKFMGRFNCANKSRNHQVAKWHILLQRLYLLNEISSGMKGLCFVEWVKMGVTS